MKPTPKRSRAMFIVGLVLAFALMFANQIINKSSLQTAGEMVDPVISSPSASLPLLFGTPLKAVTSTSVSPDFLTSVASTITARPTITPEPTSIFQPPECTFPLAQTIDKETTSEEYTFSEPAVVLTMERQPDIAGWLPDNQNVIIMSDNLHVFDGIDGYLQTIELFNPGTQETQLYATRRDFGEDIRPVWNSALNAIIYPAPNVSGEDTITKQLIVTRQIRISYGDPNTTQSLMDDLPRYYVAVKPDGSQVIYLKDDGSQHYQLYGSKVSHGSLETEKLIPFDFGQFGYEGFPMIHDMIWRLNTSQLFFYSFTGPADRTILLDVNSGQSCVLNFKGWVYFAEWSPNGRYLAVISSDSAMHSFNASYNLTILDAITGKLYEIDSTKVGPPEMKNSFKHIMGDFSWAPDNHHLVVIGMADYFRSGTSIDYVPVRKLYLVDFLSGDVNDLFPSHEFGSNWWGTSLAWSPDGSKIMTKCPTENVGRLCLIRVSTGGK